MRNFKQNSVKGMISSIFYSNLDLRLQVTCTLDASWFRKIKRALVFLIRMLHFSTKTFFKVFLDVES